MILADLAQFCRQGQVKKVDKNYSKVANLFSLKTINLFTVYFVQSFPF